MGPDVQTVESVTIQPAAAASAGAAPPATHEARLARARAILGGRLRVEPLPTTPEVKAFMERQGATEEYRLYATPEFIKKQTEWLNLGEHYPDGPVACYTAPDGTIAVLAVGMDEVEALFASIPAEERRGVVIECPTY